MWGGPGRHFDFALDTETPSINLQTLIRFDTIWPAEKKQDTYARLNDQVRTSGSLHSSPSEEFDPTTLVGISFKEDRFQLLDAPFFWDSSKEHEKRQNRYEPVLRFGPSYTGPPLVF